MVKIAFVMNALQTGGAERVLGDITMGLPEDWEIDIILADASGIKYNYRGNIIDLGIAYNGNRNGLIFFWKVFIKRLIVLYRLKKKKHYMVCIGFMDSANIANVLTGRKYCKTILSIHSNLTEAAYLPEYKYIVNPLVRLLYNKADRIVAVSKGIEADMLQHHGVKQTKLHTIYNGCRLSEIQANMQDKLTVQEQQWVEGDYVIVTMGRLDTPKAQWHLIRAFKQVVDLIPRTKLLILGEGQHNKYLKKLIRELKLDNKIVLCGFSENPFKILVHCNLFVFSSTYEGFGNAIIEAMSCGLPIVSTDFRSGAREILAPNTSVDYQIRDTIEYAEYGVLVPVCDGRMYQAEDKLTIEEKLLSEAIIRMHEDKRLRDDYANKAVERAKDFNASKMIEDWKKLIEEV